MAASKAIVFLVCLVCVLVMQSHGMPMRHGAHHSRHAKGHSNVTHGEKRQFDIQCSDTKCCWVGHGPHHHDSHNCGLDLHPQRYHHHAGCHGHGCGCYGNTNEYGRDGGEYGGYGCYNNGGHCGRCHCRPHVHHGYNDCGRCYCGHHGGYDHHGNYDEIGTGAVRLNCDYTNLDHPCSHAGHHGYTHHHALVHHGANLHPVSDTTSAHAKCRVWREEDCIEYLKDFVNSPIQGNYHPDPVHVYGQMHHDGALHANVPADSSDVPSGVAATGVASHGAHAQASALNLGALNANPSPDPLTQDLNPHPAYIPSTHADAYPAEGRVEPTDVDADEPTDADIAPADAGVDAVDDSIASAHTSLAAHGNLDTTLAGHGNLDTTLAGHGNLDTSLAAHGDLDTSLAAHGDLEAKEDAVVDDDDAALTDAQEAKLDSVDGRLAATEAKVDVVGDRVVPQEGKIDTVEETVNPTEAKIDRVTEAKVDDRIVPEHTTLAAHGGLEAKVNSVGGLEAKVDSLGNRIVPTEAKLDSLKADAVTTHAQQTLPTDADIATENTAHASTLAGDADVNPKIGQTVATHNTRLIGNVSNTQALASPSRGAVTATVPTQATVDAPERGAAVSSGATDGAHAVDNTARVTVDVDGSRVATTNADVASAHAPARLTGAAATPVVSKDGRVVGVNTNEPTETDADVAPGAAIHNSGVPAHTLAVQKGVAQKGKHVIVA